MPNVQKIHHTSGCSAVAAEQVLEAKRSHQCAKAESRLVHLLVIKPPLEVLATDAASHGSQA